MEKEVLAKCALCDVPRTENYCTNLEKTGRGPANCPSLRLKKLTEETLERTKADEGEFSHVAAIIEGASCPSENGVALRPSKPRIVEIVEFARAMRYRRLGLIFCGGLHHEASVAQRIFETNGFEVVSVMCKVGRVPKDRIGVTRSKHNDPCREREVMCNPMLQAAVANEQKTEFNILLGLCVGHDSLAMKYLEAPTTVLAVKDRCLGHNPLQAIYLYDSYYKYLKRPLP